MIVAWIRLRNFRNHLDTSLEFGEGINVFLGNNGGGKTNVLEAISYLSLTKSFYATADGMVLQIGKDTFDVEGTVITASGVGNRVHIEYSRDKGEKAYEINGARPERLSAVIGRFPIVILSPENSSITFGGPAERRRFLDLVLSQVSSAYLETLLEYRRVVRQRNRILLDARFQGTDPSNILEPWNESVARLGGNIADRRQRFVEEFQGYVRSAYTELLEDDAEGPAIHYESACIPNGSVPTPEEIAGYLMKRLEQDQSEEIRRGTTLVGPHRDDLLFTLGGIAAQHYASQGQHKTLLVALKVAEFRFLHEQREERPIFLLDDVFSELDTHRATSLVRLAAQLGQTIITTTDERVFSNSVPWNGMNKRFFVEHGTCRPI